jgi:hypothetical protein
MAQTRLATVISRASCMSRMHSITNSSEATIHIYYVEVVNKNPERSTASVAKDMSSFHLYMRAANAEVYA